MLVFVWIRGHNLFWGLCLWFWVSFGLLRFDLDDIVWCLFNYRVSRFYSRCCGGFVYVGLGIGIVCHLCHVGLVIRRFVLVLDVCRYGCLIECLCLVCIWIFGFWLFCFAYGWVLPDWGLFRLGVALDVIEIALCFKLLV